MTEKELIKEYVDDHYEYFDYYPIDVEVNGKLYDFKTYWEILDHEASSQEEAEAMADQVKERIYGEPGPWRPLYDGYTLEITSVRPEPDRSCMRPFIPNFDD